MEERSAPKHRSVLGRALLNQYNYIFLGGVGLFSVALGSWLPAIVGAGAEVLWAVLGADSRGFRRWAELQDAKEEKERLRAEAVALVGTLDRDYVLRFRTLQACGEEIQALARENQGLETSLLQTEMAKLDQLLVSFVKLAANHQRLAHYLHQNPVSDVERDIARSQRALRQEEDPRVQASLQQALALAQKRLKQHEQITGAWKALSVQMDTLEKAFDYLKSHILGMGTGAELAEELDSLVTGVATVSELEASTSELIGELHARAKVVSIKGG